MIEKFQKDLLNQTEDPEVFLTQPIGEIIHILKVIKSSFSNWFLLGLGGNIINLSMLRTLRDDNPNKEVTAALRKVLQKGSVVNRDRQDTDCLIEFSQSVPILREVIKVDPVVVHQICPEKYKLEPTNKAGSLGPVCFIGAVNIAHVAVISEDEVNKNKSVLSLLELHSPVRIKFKLEIPLVTGFVSSEAMVLISTETELLYIEIVKGTVVPKVPTKKADLVSLCEKLELDSEGTAKVLKSRLNEKLKPSTKLHTRVVKLDTELGRHLNKRSILSKSAWKDGLISSLVIVDNNLEKILKVELDYQGGDVSTKTVKINFPASVKSVELAVSSQEVDLLIYQSHLSVLNSSFDHLAVIKLDVALTDICEVGSVKSNLVCKL